MTSRSQLSHSHFTSFTYSLLVKCFVTMAFESSFYPSEKKIGEILIPICHNVKAFEWLIRQFHEKLKTNVDKKIAVTLWINWGTQIQLICIFFHGKQRFPLWNGVTAFFCGAIAILHLHIYENTLTSAHIPNPWHFRNEALFWNAIAKIDFLLLLRRILSSQENLIALYESINIYLDGAIFRSSSICAHDLTNGNAEIEF